MKWPTKIEQRLKEELEKLPLPSIEEIFPDLDEDKTRFIGLFFNLFIMGLPLIILFFIVSSNLSLRHKIQIHRGIIKNITDSKNYKKLLSSLEKSVVSPIALPPKEKLGQGYQEILSSGGETKGVITIDKFEKSEQGGTLLLTKGEVSFSQFDQEELTRLLKKILINQKMNIDKVQFSKDDQTSRIVGSIIFSHYGKRAQ